jgi:hypothetical protein
VTEQEWLDCTDPTPMLQFLGGKASDRKLRLFGCAACRTLWSFLPDVRSREAVEAAERFADGLIRRQELRKAGGHAGNVLPSRRSRFAKMITSVPVLGRHLPTHWVPGKVAVGLLHDLFGNPFRPVAIDAGWLTPTVTSLAGAAYDGRALPLGELDFARLAVLADALEEAGCTNSELLGHLRGPRPHVRGCWGVDLLLKKG